MYAVMMGKGNMWHVLAQMFNAIFASLKGRDLDKKEVLIEYEEADIDQKSGKLIEGPILSFFLKQFRKLPNVHVTLFSTKAPPTQRISATNCLIRTDRACGWKTLGRKNSTKETDFCQENLLTMREALGAGCLSKRGIKKPLQVIIVSRRTSSNRRIVNFDQTMQIFRKVFPKDANITVVAFENYSLCDQIRLVSEADVFFALRGAGQALAMFLSDGAAFVPVFYPESAEPWFPLSSEMSHLHVVNLASARRLMCFFKKPKAPIRRKPVMRRKRRKSTIQTNAKKLNQEKRKQKLLQLQRRRQRGKKSTQRKLQSVKEKEKKDESENLVMRSCNPHNNWAMWTLDLKTLEQALTIAKEAVLSGKKPGPMQVIGAIVGKKRAAPIRR
jgi:hypothetical protein